MPFKSVNNHKTKKKPPPRPPPPNLNKPRSKSTHNIHKQFETLNLIDWSPPNSPRVESTPAFGGSVSSSFSSSTSSLASSKKSTDYDGTPTFSNIFWNGNFGINGASSLSSQVNTSQNTVPSLFGPTIIRPQQKKVPRYRVDHQDNSTSAISLPMPTVPPPSPPKDVGDVITPYGIAQFEFPALQAGDLHLEVDDVVILIRRINQEWLYGQVVGREGMFPENFINVIVPLPEDAR